MSRKPQSTQRIDPKMMAAVTKELPRVLVEEGYLKNTNNANTTEERMPATPTHTTVPRGNRKNLWIPVAVFALVIFGIWMFNIKNVIADVWGNQGAAGKIVDQSKSDFHAVLETIKKNDADFQKRLNASIPTAAATSATTSVENALKDVMQNYQKIDQDKPSKQM